MAEGKQVDLVVITPERQLLEEPADSVVFTAHDGALGVLHDRAPLMCELGIGQVRYTQGSKTHHVFIDGGFAQVFDNRVTILTSQALPAEAVTADVVAAAEADVAGHTGTDPESMEQRERAQRRAAALRAMQAAG